MKRKASLEGSSGGDDDDQVVKPSVSFARRIKSCESCKRLKIKCHLPETGPPCAECVVRGKECVLGQSIHTWVEQQAVWQRQVTEDIDRLKQALDLYRSGFRHPHRDGIGNSSGADADPQLHHRHSSDTHSVGAASPSSVIPPPPGPPPPPSWAPINAHGNGNARPGEEPLIIHEKTDQHLPSIPGRYLYEATEDPSFAAKLQDRPVNRQEEIAKDLVTRGVVSLQLATQLFSKFKKLDQYIYGVSVNHPSLESVRGSSALLTACVCAVAALHEPGMDEVYELAEAEFKDLLSSCMFARAQSVDDTKAICLGAFWLHNLCFPLSSLMVPFSYDLNVEPALDMVLKETDQLSDSRLESYLRLRLWYMLFICDHQFSIPYGKAPAIRANAAVRFWERFSQCDLASENDLRIASQVHLWSIMDRASDEFGASGYVAVSPEKHSRVRTYLVELDMYRIQWGTKFQKNTLVGNYPEKGCAMHCHFAKLYICLIPLRGKLSHSEELSPALSEFASQAILSAQTIIRLFVGDPETYDMLVGLPLYFHTMISFASIFLLKSTAIYTNHFDADRSSVFALVDRFVTMLTERSKGASKHHIIASTASGLRRVLERLGDSSLGGANGEIIPSTPSQAVSLWSTLLDESFDSAVLPVADFNLMIHEVELPSEFVGDHGLN